MVQRIPQPGDLEPIERASRDELQALQLERLKWTLQHAYDNVPHYRRAFDARGRASGRPEDAGRPGEVPVHGEEGPARQLSVRPVRRAARAGGARACVVAARPASRPSSATRSSDIDTWADLVARSIRAAGGRPGDMVHIAYGYGLFTGGLGAHYGAERLGCTVDPDVGRADREAGAADPRLPARHHHGDAVVHAEHRRGVRSARAWIRRESLAEGRHLRRRAVDRGDARARSRRAPASTRSTSTACRK